MAAISKPWRKFGGQVLQGMHGQIDASGSERLLDFLREHALGADLRERDIGNLVAGGVNDLDLDFMTPFAQECGNVVGLPKRKLRTAGTNAELRVLRFVILVIHFPDDRF